MHVSIEVDDGAVTVGRAAPATATPDDQHAHDEAGDGTHLEGLDGALDGGEPSPALLAAVAAAANGAASPDGEPGPDVAPIDAGPAPA
jgi:hypothetical protein